MPVLLLTRYHAPELGRNIPIFATGFLVNVAVQDISPFTVTEPSKQSLLPLQPVKVESVPGTAVRVTVVILENCAKQLVPQLIAETLAVTVPVPVPASEIVNE